MKVEHYSDGFETKVHLILDSGYRLRTSFSDDELGDVTGSNDSALLVIAEANAITTQAKRIEELEGLKNCMALCFMRIHGVLLRMDNSIFKNAIAKEVRDGIDYANKSLEVKQ